MRQALWQGIANGLKDTCFASVLSSVHTKMKTDWSHLEKYRIQRTPYISPIGATHGAFEIPPNGTRKRILRVIATAAMPELGPEGEWEHVSVHAYDASWDLECIPDWAEMAFIKDLFWNEDECVVQYHPSKKDYVNIHGCVLHLWKPTKETIPMPPKICV